MCERIHKKKYEKRKVCVAATKAREGKAGLGTRGEGEHAPWLTVARLLACYGVEEAD